MSVPLFPRLATYRLPNADDAYYDRGELPPIKEPGPLFGYRE